MEQVGRGLWKHTFLEAEGGTTDGEWVDISRFESVSVEIVKTGSPTFEADICGRLCSAKPENTHHGVKLGNSHTDNAMYEITAPIRWLKVKVNSNNGDADNYIDSNLLGREKRQ
jgi:hypothetical protein